MITVICGPAGCGKTTNAGDLAKFFKCNSIADDFHPSKPYYFSSSEYWLVLTSVDEDQVKSSLPMARVLSFKDAMKMAGLFDGVQALKDKAGDSGFPVVICGDGNKDFGNKAGLAKFFNCSMVVDHYLMINVNAEPKNKMIIFTLMGEELARLCFPTARILGAREACKIAGLHYVAGVDAPKIADVEKVNDQSTFNTLFASHLNEMAAQIHEHNVKAGWWRDSKNLDEIAATGDFDDAFIERMKATVVASKLALVHSEVTEALEGYRKDLMDDHLPRRKMVEVELADAIIRILDLAEYLQLNVGRAIVEKIEYNAQRADHKIENRDKEGGKKI